jgi:hypothetical protein
MTDYSDLELHNLLDLLVRHTSDYTKMLSQEILPVEEFAQCRQTLAELQNAIEAKHRLGMKIILPESKKETG